MAVSRKTNDAPPGVNLKHLDDLVPKIETAMSKSIDARGVIGNHYQRAEDMGFNRSALKLSIKLRNMEVAKRSDFLASLNMYCEHLGVFAQADMFSPGEQGVGPKEGDVPIADPIAAARSAGLRDGGDGKANFAQYEDGSPEFLAYHGGWNESQAALVAAQGGPRAASSGD